ncbi:MAG: serine--tRNA ligase [Chlorobi bacterium]|nr:serine--tRNA ligase [Chlorobiota bacterium]
MLEIRRIRENFDAVARALDKRRKDYRPLLRKALDLDEEKRALKTRIDALLAELNTLSREIGKLFKQGERKKAEVLRAATAKLKEEVKELQGRLDDTTRRLNEILWQIPNVPHESVPEGASDEDNEVVFQWGELPRLPQDAKPHWDLAKEYDIIDFELGTKITGAGFPVYKDYGARLQRALINFFLDRNRAAGYTEVQPPHLINEASGFGTGQLPDKEGQMYHIEKDNLYLVPTAEVPVTNFYRDVILDEKDFPIKNTAYTPCFRREAGSWGAHVRGLNRLHQFDKVEIVRIEHPDQSYEALDEMVEHVKSLLQDLNLPFRIVRLCGGDLGFTSALTYDFEVWSGAQQRWLEVSSVSNFETFQANRLKLRFRDKQNKKHLAHTLNGSALALPRVVAALLENNQTPEGIVIPEVLLPYTGFDIIHRPEK